MSVIKRAPLSPESIAYLDNHFKHVKDLIINRIEELSRDATEEDVLSKGLEHLHLSQAISEYAPGKKVSIAPEKGRFFELFPPFTILCFLLAIIFAFFGIYALNNNSKITGGNGFIDISKIFAGAIVGSTTSIVLGSMSSKSKRK